MKIALGAYWEGHGRQASDKKSRGRSLYPKIGQSTSPRPSTGPTPHPRIDFLQSIVR
jgi:hypothetical protein